MNRSPSCGRHWREFERFDEKQSDRKNGDLMSMRRSELRRSGVNRHFLTVMCRMQLRKRVPGTFRCMGVCLPSRHRRRHQGHDQEHSDAARAGATEDKPAECGK